MRPDADLVARAAIFEALGSADLQALALCFRGRRYPPGEVVFREGDPGRSLFLVGEGMLVATARTAGAPREIGRYGPGQVLGTSTMAEPAPRPATVMAAVPSVAFELSADAVELLRAGAPAAARALEAAGLRSLLTKLRKLEHRIERELDRDPGATPVRPGAR